MKKWYLIKNRKRLTQRGQGLIEYALIITLVGVALIVTVNLFEDALRNTFDSFIGRGEFAPPAIGPIGGNFTPRPATPTPVPVPPEISAFAVNGDNPYQISDPTEQHEFSFVMSASDSDGIITQYKFEIDLNNDGTVDDEIVWFPSDPVPTYTLGRGNHIIKLTVSDSTSLTTSRQLPVQVYVDSSELQDLPPTVDISVSPLNGVGPLTVNLSGVATPDHDSTITRYTWVLGNGATRTGASITYTYETGGTFEVYLQVEDNEGFITDSERKIVNVVAPTATPTLTPTYTPTPVLKQYRYIMLLAESEVNGGPWTSVAELYAIDGFGSEIARDGWSKHYVDSEESDGLAEYAWDGNTGTIWHSKWRGGSPAHPHQVQINMGADYSLSGFRYIPRQSGENGRVRGYRLCASVNGINFELLKAGVFPNTNAEQVVSFTPPEPSSPVVSCAAVATPTPSSTPSPTVTPSRTPTITPTPTNTPQAIHVADLDGTSNDTGSRWEASVTITVHKSGEAIVQGATVTGSWSNGASGTSSCTTNSLGLCSVVKGNLNNGTKDVTFTVTNITFSGHTYTSSANHDPDGDSNGTTITVDKP